MIQAFYSAAVGAQQQMQKMNVQANNIANVNTCGFKAEKPAFHALMYGLGQWDRRGSASEGERDAHGIHRDRLQSGTC